MRKSTFHGSKFDPRRSLQAQLGLLFGTLTILLTMALSGAAGQQTKASIELNIGRSMEQMAHQLTDDLDRGVYDYYIETQNVALDSTIRNGQAPLETQRSILFRIKALYSDIVSISLVSESGQVIVSTDSNQEQQDVSHETWFVTESSGPRVQDVSIESMSPPSPERDAAEIVLVRVTVPWLDENDQPRGLVVTAVNSNLVDVRIHELLMSATFSDLQVVVTRADGTIIATSGGITPGASWRDQPSYQMTLQHDYGYMIESPDDEDEYLTGYAVTNGFRDYAGLDWRVMVRKDADKAFAPANEIMLRQLLTGLGLGLVIAGLSWWLGQRLTRPLVNIATAADAIRNGQEVMQLPTIKGQDEVARLGQSLRGLVDRLTHAINERTLLETQFRTIFESSLDVILVADGGNGTLLQVNSAVRRVLGYDPTALVGQPFVNLFPSDQSTRDEILARLRAYGAVIEEQEFRRADGAVLLMDLTATMIPYRGSSAILVTLRDISERHQLMLAQLESDVMRNQLAAQEQALNMKSTIVSVASHDLRNPLATILLSSDIIRRYGDRIPEEKRIGHFLRIETSIKYMQKLLDDLSLMEKLERGLVKPAREPIDMDEFCHTLMDEALASTELTTEFRFSLDPACQNINQDPRLLRQAISNLLTNALKYSRDGQPIEFSVACTPTDHIRIIVRDYGIGIPATDQKDLFKTFHRAKNASSIPGTGLGLAITRRAVDSMQGTLEFLSVEGEGTTFIIDIPLNPAPREL